MLIRQMMRNGHVLRAPAGEGGDGGGGGGTPPGGDPTEIPDALRDVMTKTINATVATHMKRLAEKQTETFKTMLEETVKTLKPAEPPAPKDGDKGGEGKPDPTVAKLQNQLDELTKQLKLTQQEKEAEQLKARTTEERNELTAALRNGNVLEHMIKPLVTFLHTESGKIKRTDDGQIVFVMPRKGFEEELPLSEGITEWLSTDEGKGYVKPVETSGSGNRGGQSRTISGKQLPSLGEILSIATEE